MGALPSRPPPCYIRAITPAEADQRIIKSRQALHRYRAMVAAGQLPVMDMGLMNDELEWLERIADRHPEKEAKIVKLGEDWLELMATIRAKLN